MVRMQASGGGGMDQSRRRSTRPAIYVYLLFRRPHASFLSPPGPFQVVTLIARIVTVDFLNFVCLVL